MTGRTDLGQSSEGKDFLIDVSESTAGRPMTGETDLGQSSEGKDFHSNLSKSTGGRPVTDRTDLATTGKLPRQYPPEILDAGVDILRALAERAASKRRVFEMLEFLELERQMLKGAPHG